MTSSSNEPVSEALGNSRRAARSSSATSGRPPDRSATRSSRLADARSPSIPSMRAASSSRSSGGSVRLSGGRGPAVIAPMSDVHGSSRPTTSGWWVPMIARRCSREIRARNVISARVAESAWCRSSMTRTTGCCSPSRPSRPRIPSSVRAWRRSGAVGPPPATGAPTSTSRGSRSGSSRMTSDVAGPSRPARTSAGRSRRAGPIARTMGPYGSSALAGQAVARRTVIGSRSARIRSMASSRKRVTPTPAVPPSSRVRVTSVRGVVESPGEAAECLFSPHEARARVPDRHAAFYGPGGDRPSHVPTGGVG